MFDLVINTIEKRMIKKDYQIYSDVQDLMLKSIKHNNNPHWLKTGCNFFVKI